jgi:hypothetical protein
MKKPFSPRRGEDREDILKREDRRGVRNLSNKANEVSRDAGRGK